MPDSAPEMGAAEAVLTIPGTSRTDTIPAEEKIGLLAGWRSQ